MMVYPIGFRRGEREEAPPAATLPAAPRNPLRNSNGLRVADFAAPRVEVPAVTEGAAAPRSRPVQRLQRELARGLRYTHFRANANTSELIQIASVAQAARELLEEKGVLKEKEFEARRATAADRISKQYSARGLGVSLETSEKDKYSVESGVRIDCENRVHLCKAACCKLRFALSRQDLDEGVVRWDVGNPYVIAQGDDHYCVHLDRQQSCCGIYSARPITCRNYDCRKDNRIWLDFEQKIVNPAINGQDWPQTKPDGSKNGGAPAAEQSKTEEIGLPNRLLGLFTAHPVMGEFGNRFLSAYGVFLSAGWALGAFYWLVLLSRRFPSMSPPWFLLPALALAAYAGSKGLMAIESKLSRELGQQEVAGTGNTFYGGFAAVAAVFALWRPAGFLAMADCAAPAIALGYAFGKLGCLASGCCAGCLTRRRFAVAYEAEASKAVGFYGLKGVPLAPVQLYEALLGLALFMGLAIAPAEWFGSGRVFGALLAALAAGRSVLMPFRYRAPEERAGSLISGLVHLAMMGVGLVLLSGAPVHSEQAAPAPLGGAVLTASLTAVLTLYLFGVHQRNT